MGARTIGGEAGDLLKYVFNIAAAWTTAAVGDQCALDTSANLTVKDTVNDAVPFGRIVAIDPDGDRCTVEVYGPYRAVRAFTSDAAVGVGTSINIKGAAANIVETKAADGVTLVISDPGAAGTVLVLV